MITPILLCGGSGTRLWPLSRKSYPKQFVPLVGDTTLFQASAARLSGPGYAPPVVLTNSDFRFIVTEQLTGVGIDPGAILIEPARQEHLNGVPGAFRSKLWRDHLQMRSPPRQVCRLTILRLGQGPTDARRSRPRWQPRDQSLAHRISGTFPGT